MAVVVYNSVVFDWSVRMSAWDASHSLNAMLANWQHMTSLATMIVEWCHCNAHPPHVCVFPTKICAALPQNTTCQLSGARVLLMGWHPTIAALPRKTTFPQKSSFPHRLRHHSIWRHIQSYLHILFHCMNVTQPHSTPQPAHVTLFTQ